MCTVINAGLAVFLLTIQPHSHLLAPFGPWRELAAVVQRYEEQAEDASGREPLIVAEGKYRLASVLAFYRSPLETRVRAADFTTSQWYLGGGSGLGYPYWADSRDWTGADIIYVDDDKDISEIEKRFEQVRVVYDSGSKYAKRYRVAICRGLREAAPG